MNLNTDWPAKLRGVCGRCPHRPIFLPRRVRRLDGQVAGGDAGYQPALQVGSGLSDSQVSSGSSFFPVLVMFWDTTGTSARGTHTRVPCSPCRSPMPCHAMRRRRKCHMLRDTGPVLAGKGPCRSRDPEGSDVGAGRRGARGRACLRYRGTSPVAEAWAGRGAFGYLGPFLSSDPRPAVTKTPPPRLASLPLSQILTTFSLFLPSLSLQKMPSELQVQVTAPNKRTYTQPLGLFINNEWRASSDGGVITSINPS